ncbi:hypothetical protein [Kordia sp.]|uniref:hypothetical protein n=1 Tax=Kordia sp. TaxID=1965332 RepID=UPI0025BA0E0C|nr:hypothetical protein [Kordia sp.]MCH2083128.1 hypothetical protein [Saprospiraceae bacterium]MCH2193305.1 hypothetical protein [Kordia sp.]
MISYLKRKEINDQLWNTTVQKAKNGLPYFYTWHLDNCCKHWSALVWEEYKFIMPLPYNNKLLITKQLFQPILTQQLGIIGNGLTANIAEQFLKNIPPYFKYINIQLHHKTPTIDTNDKGTTLWPNHIHTKDNYVIPLDKEEEILIKGLNREIRRNLRKLATKHNIKPINSAQIIVDFYFKQFGKKLNLSLTTRQTIFNIMDAHLKHNTIEIYGCYDNEEQLCCATAFLHSHDRLISIFGGPSEAGKKIYAMHAIYAHVIKKYANTPKIVDFMGSEIKGVAFWMRSMGGILQPYFKYEVDDLPRLISFIKHRKWKVSN